MAVKGALSVCGSGTLDMRADLGDDGRTEGHVRHKVAVHDVDLHPSATRPDAFREVAEAYVQPVGALANSVGACPAQLCEIGRQNGRCDDGRRRHGGGVVVRRLCGGRCKKYGVQRPIAKGRAGDGGDWWWISVYNSQRPVVLRARRLRPAQRGRSDPTKTASTTTPQPCVIFHANCQHHAASWH